VNVGDTERWVSAAGGMLLGLYGLSGRGLFNQLVLPAIGGMLAYRGLTGHCSCYASLGINTADKRGPATAIPAGEGVKVEERLTIHRPAAELFREWRQLQNLPRFMSHLKEVRVLDGKRSHWVAQGPMGMSVAWDAEIINERPGELLAWRSLPGADVDTAGSVHFEAAPGGLGTVVRVVLKYDPPAGKAGAAAARWLGDAPEQLLRDDLQRFKQHVEAGGHAALTGSTGARW
jgi:uncharacterized membrane protein